MQKIRYDRFAIFPTQCDKCKRIVWLEGYDVYYKAYGINHQRLMRYKCKRCIAKEQKEME